MPPATRSKVQEIATVMQCTVAVYSIIEIIYCYPNTDTCITYRSTLCSICDFTMKVKSIPL